MDSVSNPLLMEGINKIEAFDGKTGAKNYW
jgi:hypothetical protein